MIIFFANYVTLILTYFIWKLFFTCFSFPIDGGCKASNNDISTVITICSGLDLKAKNSKVNLDAL